MSTYLTTLNVWACSLYCNCTRWFKVLIFLCCCFYNFGELKSKLS